MPLSGAFYSYFSSGQVAVKSRFDRFLIFNKSGDWLANYIQRAILCHISDHFLIMLVCGSFNIGLRPLRFFNVWSQDQDLRNLVTSRWESSSLTTGSLWENSR